MHVTATATMYACTMYACNAQNDCDEDIHLAKSIQMWPTADLSGESKRCSVHAPRLHVSQEGKVLCLEASSDGRFLFSGCSDGAVRMHDLRTPTRAGQLLWQHSSDVTAMSYEVCGQRRKTNAGSENHSPHLIRK
jgi:WD40 repeat protein